MSRQRFHWILLVGFLSAEVFASAQEGAITGLVTDAREQPVHHARILLVQTGDTAETGHDGRYRFQGIAPGTYDIFAQVASLTSQARLVEVRGGETAVIDLVLELSPIRDSVTVTARGRHETTFEAVQSVNSLETFDIAEKMAPSVGEVLDGELGISKRSFGTGSARPVIRGFDGDRVLVLRDGMPTGSLGSQSGDHGEPVDPSSLERLEVVKGPATLLYGSNAIGGVVNAISRHHELHKHRHEGIRGQVASAAGSNNALGGGSASVEYGKGNWMFWGSGGGQRTGDYSSPDGKVENSKSRVTNGSFGLGWFGNGFYLSGGYAVLDGRYGIPFANEFHSHEHGAGEQEGEAHEEHGELEAVDVAWQSNTLRLNTGFQSLDSLFDNIRIALNYTEWQHDELELLHDGDELVGTAFQNDQFSYRGDFDHFAGPLSGTIGIWGTVRNYRAAGEEALSPPVDQNVFAVFALEELTYESWKLQFGGRLEHSRYQPGGPGFPGHEHDHEAGDDAQEVREYLPGRKFTGFSGSVGLRGGLWDRGAFVAHLTSAYRAPSLEELYNYGPHVGNLAFEIGNPELNGERSNGLDLSLRHSGRRLRAEGNFFFYSIGDFIYGAPTGEVKDGLYVLDYQQGDTRFVGAEFGLDLGLNDSFWLNTGLDLVNARLMETGTPLPRIPPLRGRIGLDFRYRQLSMRPEVVLAARQDDIFPTETETAGYGVVNLKASYTYPRQHFVHHFAFVLFNIGDNLYRNHVSFIKDLAPEMGRGVRLSYAVKFF